MNSARTRSGAGDRFILAWLRGSHGEERADISLTAFAYEGHALHGNSGVGGAGFGAVDLAKGEIATLGQREDGREVAGG